MTTYTFENSSSSQTPQPARVPWVACAIEANSEVEALVDYLHFNKESLEGTTGVELIVGTQSAATYGEYIAFREIYSSLPISNLRSRWCARGTELRIRFEGSDEYIRASAL